MLLKRAARLFKRREEFERIVNNICGNLSHGLYHKMQHLANKLGQISVLLFLFHSGLENRPEIQKEHD